MIARQADEWTRVLLAGIDEDRIGGGPLDFDRILATSPATAEVVGALDRMAQAKAPQARRPRPLIDRFFHRAPPESSRPKTVREEEAARPHIRLSAAALAAAAPSRPDAPPAPSAPSAANANANASAGAGVGAGTASQRVQGGKEASAGPSLTAHVAKPRPPPGGGVGGDYKSKAPGGVFTGKFRGAHASATKKRQRVAILSPEESKQAMEKVRRRKEEEQGAGKGQGKEGKGDGKEGKGEGQPS